MKRPPSSKLTPAKSRIYLVDDHPLTREGLAALINQKPDLEVCGVGGSAAKALPEIEKLMPDLAVIDLSLAGGPNGLELIKDLAARHPRLPMLVLSTNNEELYAERVLRAGARGYVMKQEPTEQVIEAMQTVLRGKIYLSKAMNDRMLLKLAGTGRAVLPASDLEKLSDRELEVYRLIGQGHGTQQIAAKLRLSVSTVQTYREHIKQKLHFTNAPELMLHAVEWVQSQKP